MDSMVNHYTSAKKPRSEDAYTPGGKRGKRPDRAVNVYCKCIRNIYGDIPIVIGGIEASLRRFAHYDYWDNRVLPSVLVSSGADLLIYGMGERQIIDITAALLHGILPMLRELHIGRITSRACMSTLLLTALKKYQTTKKLTVLRL